MAKVKKEGQGQIFANSPLEVFTKTNPFLHILTYGGVISVFFYLNNAGFTTTLIYFLTGIFMWTLVEYLMHRYLFHINESKFQYMIHGVHHEYPRDKERLMMPPLPGIITISIFTAIWYLAFWENTFAFMAGFILGYMLYTFIHYILHTWKPINGIKFLWAHHHKHHNPAFQNKAFGVSSPLWDYVFGTMPR